MFKMTLGMKKEIYVITFMKRVQMMQNMDIFREIHVLKIVFIKTRRFMCRWML